jgi:tetratricopeptide (TPR) repeat protein
MANNEFDIINEPVKAVEIGYNRVESFVEKNKKNLLIGGGVLVGAVVLTLGYQEFIQKPLEVEAQEALYKAQNLFAGDSVKAALNGNAEVLGFLDIADEYGWTKAGNLAQYYAGLCYLDLGQPQEAIESLESFSSSDGLLEANKWGSIADAFMDLKQPDEALDYYVKAANIADNDLQTPFFLKKAALTAEMLEDFDAALGYYERIKADYSQSTEGFEAARDIAYCKAKLGQE